MKVFKKKEKEPEPELFSNAWWLTYYLKMEKEWKKNPERGIVYTDWTPSDAVKEYKALMDAESS